MSLSSIFSITYNHSYLNLPSTPQYYRSSLMSNVFFILLTEFRSLWNIRWFLHMLSWNIMRNKCIVSHINGTITPTDSSNLLSICNILVICIFVNTHNCQRCNHLGWFNVTLSWIQTLINVNFQHWLKNQNQLNINEISVKEQRTLTRQYL